MSHVFTAHILHIYDGVACVVHVYTGGEYNSHATCAYSFSMHINLFMFMQYFKLFERKKYALRHEGDILANMIRRIVFWSRRLRLHRGNQPYAREACTKMK